MRRRRNTLAAALAVLFLISAVAAVYEYSAVQSLNDQTRDEKRLTNAAEVVYNIPGVAIPITCCPSLESIITVGQYVFNSSDFAPITPFYINGTRYPGSDGTMLLFEVARLSAPTVMQNASFIWRGTFNESVPFPGNSSIFDGHVVFHWYLSQGILFMHIQTA